MGLRVLKRYKTGPYLLEITLLMPLHSQLSHSPSHRQALALFPPLHSGPFTHMCKQNTDPFKLTLSMYHNPSETRTVCVIGRLFIPIKEYQSSKFNSLLIRWMKNI